MMRIFVNRTVLLGTIAISTPTNVFSLNYHSGTVFSSLSVRLYFILHSLSQFQSLFLVLKCSIRLCNRKILLAKRDLELLLPS